MSKEDFSEIKELAKQINDLAIVANERYYLPIDPEATASYIYTYRDMWDSDEE